VDINPMAVEICRLRLWLSLVIELEAVWRREIPALPSLELRIVAGDSLVDRMGAEAFVQSLPLDYVQFDFEMVARQKRLNELHEMFEAVDRSDRRDRLSRMRELTAEIWETQLEIAQVQVDAAINKAERSLQKTAATTRDARARAGLDSQLSALRALKDNLRPDAPFQKPLLWPLVFPQTFKKERGGFDVVLANPPYVRQESLSPIDQEAYRHAFPEVYAGTADLLVYFSARAVQLLRDSGQLAFITSNKYMRAAYGAGLREYLPKQLQIDRVIDFGDLPVFDVAAYPAVVTGRKTAAPDPHGVTTVAELVWPIRRKLREEERAVNVANVRLT
jgi:adenine-specific DNA-methyltransferase